MGQFINITTFGRSLVDDATASAARTTLGLGTAAVQNTGTSGTNVPLLDGSNTYSGATTFSNATFNISSSSARVALGHSSPATNLMLDVRNVPANTNVSGFALSTGTSGIATPNNKSCIWSPDWDDGRAKLIFYNTIGTDLQILNADGTNDGTLNLRLTTFNYGSAFNGTITALSRGKSSTTADTTMASIVDTWIDSTHASRKARRTFNVYDTAVREALRLDATGSAAQVGVGGAVSANSNLLMVNGTAEMTNVRINTTATAPSTTGGGSPGTYYGATGTNYLSEPSGWIAVNVNGTAGKVPYYT